MRCLAPTRALLLRATVVKEEEVGGGGERLQGQHGCRGAMECCGWACQEAHSAALRAGPGEGSPLGGYAGLLSGAAPSRGVLEGFPRPT